MTLDVAPATETVAVPWRRHRRRGVVLLALGLFQLWLWGTRIVNLLGASEGFTTAFVAVHLGLYVVAIGAGVLLAGLGLRLWQEAVAARSAADGTGQP